MAKPLVSDALWQRIEPLLPPSKPRRFRFPGRRPLDYRQILTGIGFVLQTGINWEDLPAELGWGCGKTGKNTLKAWQAAGIWERLHHLLLEELQDADQMDWSRAAVDSTFARAFGGVEGSGKNSTDRGRPGVKQHVLVDAQGIPLAGEVTAAHVPEIKALVPLVDSCGPRDESGKPQRLPEEVYGDRAYASEPHREELRQRGVEPELAERNTEHGSGLGVFRWVAARTISWLHSFRKLRFVTAKTKPMQYACFDVALALICFRFLEIPEPPATPSFC